MFIINQAIAHRRCSLESVFEKGIPIGVFA